jgi:hypothetical protein
MARGDASSRGTASVPAAFSSLKELLHASHTRRWISLARSVVPLEVRMPLFIALLPNRTLAQLATGIAVEGCVKATTD